jgi:hypothetical protein
MAPPWNGARIQPVGVARPPRASRTPCSRAGAPLERAARAGKWTSSESPSLPSRCWRSHVPIRTRKNRGTSGAQDPAQVLVEFRAFERFSGTSPFSPAKCRATRSISRDEMPLSEVDLRAAKPEVPPRYLCLFASKCPARGRSPRDGNTRTSVDQSAARSDQSEPLVSLCFSRHRPRSSLDTDRGRRSTPTASLHATNRVVTRRHCTPFGAGPLRCRGLRAAPPVPRDRILSGGPFEKTRRACAAAVPHGAGRTTYCRASLVSRPFTRGPLLRSEARRSEARRSEARRSEARRSEARRSEARRSEARPGAAERCALVSDDYDGGRVVLSSRFRSLPVTLRGRSSRISTWRGTLYAARCLRQ